MPTGESTPGTEACAKIDSAATNGLLGVHDSLAYRVHENERHSHNWERWFGLANVPDAEVHVADRIGVTGTPFQMDAGNNDWGAWIQVLGSLDTPTAVGSVYYDLHRLQVVAVERTTAVHFVQLAQGASAALALASRNYTEFVFHPLGQQGQRVPIPVLDRRQEVGTKSWVRCMAPGQNTALVSFFHGLHEYEG